MLRKKGLEHEYSWIYKTGLGLVEDEKTLMYVFHQRTFTTSKNTEMSNLYCWDGFNIFKVVVFPVVFKKIKNLIKTNQWFAVRLEKIEDKKTLTRLDSYKIQDDRGIIGIDDYIERKKLKEDQYA